MVELLKTAYNFVKNGDVFGIRVSTRPDAIDEEILKILKQYGVTSIELGAQSLDDRVLEMNNRGHTALDVKNASLLIKQFGFSLGLQMMTGLYGDSDETSIKTAKEIISLKPDTVRIYPTIVLKDTDLGVLYKGGLYKPQTLENAVELSAKLLMMFYDADIKVIRLGLHTIESDSYLAGPWHPAFSELCQSRLFLKKAISLLGEKGNYTIYVNKSDVSKMTGQKKSNINALIDLGYNCKIMTDNTLGNYQIKVERS
ncbi:MAG: radical SAM protein [Clostridia bacterium]|nr:radical SAM protein [Clostridia bacterium]